MNTNSKFSYRAPTGFKRAWTITGSVGVARLLFRQSDNAAFADVTFWAKHEGQPVKKLFVPMEQVDFASANPNFCAVLDTAVNKPGVGLPLLDPRDLIEVPASALETGGMTTESDEEFTMGEQELLPEMLAEARN